MAQQLQKGIKIFFLLSLLVGMLPGIAQTQSIGPGDIIITEFMASPSAVADGEGEYIEIYNRRSFAINIDGFTLSDDGTDLHTIDNGGSLTIPAESFIVLAAGSSPGFTPDYVFGSGGTFSLTNSNDEIVLTDTEGTNIARLDYNSSKVFDGASLELNDIKNIDTHGEADILDYNESNSLIVESTDNGSPGTAGQTKLDEPPSVRLFSDTSIVSENSGSILITVLLEDPGNNRVSVDLQFNTSSSSSVAEDFIGPTTQTLSYPPGASDGSTQSARFTINNDSEYEGTETAVFTLANLSSSGNVQLKPPKVHQLSILDNETAGVVINEVLFDPAGSHSEGDANRDGTRHSREDEFVEILNTEDVSVDLGGWELTDNSDNPFVFPKGTILPPNSAAVVFGGGNPNGSFGGSLVFTSMGFSLTNGEDEITLRDYNQNVVDAIAYGGRGEPDATDQSLVRSPEGTGDFIRHTRADSDDNSPFSPGTKTNGTNFTNSVTIEGSAGWRILSSPVDGMNISDLIDNTAIQGYPGYDEGADKNFYVGYDGNTFLPADNINSELENGKGFILYFSNDGNQWSTNLPVTLDVNSGRTHNRDVTGVPLHTNGDKWNLLGNPFETTIDISDIEKWVDGTNGLASGVGQVWDDKSGSFIPASINNNKVAPWQGFFIRNDDATTIDFPQSAKTTGARFYKQTENRGLISLTLKGQGNSEEIQTTDKAAVLYFHEEATHREDSYDAAKLMPFTNRHALIGFVSGTSPDVTAGTTSLKAQESRPFNFEGDLSFDMQLLTSNMQGEFELSWNKRNLPDTWNFTLTDNITGETVDMNSEQYYRFTDRSARKERSISEESDIKRTMPSATTAQARQDQEARFTLEVSKPGGTNTNSPEIPEQVKLNPNYPNPFNPSTTISFELTEQSHVTLNVYTIVGQKVATLVDEVRETGEHRETWNASEMPSGIYIAQLEVQGKVYIRKMTLIK